MKNLQKWICLFLLAALGVQLLAGCAGQPLVPPARTEQVDLTSGFTAASAEGGLVKISENDRFVLYADLSNGEAAVEDKAQRTTWYTNPADKAEDGLASGFNKNALQSVITVVYTTALSVDMTCGGFMSSVRKDGLSYRLEEDGSVIFLFDFPNEAFTIPVRYAIREDCFTASILAEGVREYGDNKVKTVDLLPFFGAGGTEDEGYMLLPDGCGALVYYNNGRLTAQTYAKPLYGFDNGLSDVMSQPTLTLSENQSLPVFGVHRNEAGFLAILTEGAARATINANVARKYTLYNTVWPTYAFRAVGSVTQTQKDGSQLVTKVAEKKLETWQDFTVSYYFLENGKSSYSDMAAFYRDYLAANSGLTNRIQSRGGSFPLYLDLYGYIEKRKSFLGIPMDRKISMTTVEDANTLLDQLSQAGIAEVILKYNDWATDSYYRRLPVNASVDSKVGNAAQMLALQQRLADSGGALYLSADLLNVYKNGNGVTESADALRSVANTTQRQFVYNSRAGIDTRYDPWYLLRPSSVNQVFRRFADQMKKAGYRYLALDGAGEMLYSELGTSGTGRNQMVQVMTQAVEEVAAAGEGLLLSNANDYAAALAAHVVNTPSKASNYDLEDVSIPFYQMVFHGYVSYSLSAVNLYSNPAEATLKHLEYGACPMFSLIVQNADELIGSRLDRLYSADAADWLDYLAEEYAQLKEVLDPVYGQTVREHRILSEAVRAVTYEDGTTVYVNYGEKPVEAEGIPLEAMGYAVTRDGSVISSGVAVGDM